MIFISVLEINKRILLNCTTLEDKTQYSDKISIQYVNALHIIHFVKAVYNANILILSVLSNGKTIIKLYLGIKVADLSLTEGINNLFDQVD